MTKPDKARQAAERIVVSYPYILPEDEYLRKRLASRIARAIRAGYERGKVDGRRSVPVCWCDCVKLEAVAEAARAFHEAALTTTPGGDAYRREMDTLSDALAALEEI